MDTLRVLIVEDEPLARRRLAKLLQGRADFEVIGTCGDGREAVEAIQQQDPDLVLLDVQMPEMDGFEVLEAIGLEHMPAVIFVTAYDRYALRAFEIHALDYLLKPFDDERFENALKQAKARIRHRQIEGLGQQLLALAQDLREEKTGTPVAHSVPEEPEYLERIALKSSGRITILKTEEVDWIEGAGVYVKLHVGKKTHLLRETLKNLEESLPPAQFVRIHRSTIVNVERVKELASYFHGEYIVILHDGTQLKLSRTYRDKLQALVGKLG